MNITRTFGVGLWTCAVVLLIGAAPAWGAAGGDEGNGGAELSERELLGHVREIDRLVNEGLRKHGVRPNPSLGQEEFLRRAYLDIIGRVPTLEEAREYLASNAVNKRPDLINKLLDSPGYVSHSFNYFADLLRVKDRLNNNVSGRPYMRWIKQSLRENKPYDQFVYELLTASGRVHEKGATGYYLRDSGMSLDNTSNTVRVFLGTSIGCAMCHDHPFDKWSQREFYEMAAFTYGTRTRDGGPVSRKLNKLAEEQEKQENGRLANTLRGLARSYSYKVHETDRSVRLPHDYKYSDGEPNQTVSPFTIFGSVVEGPAEGKTLRETFAGWLTSKENPRFAKVIANRLWKRAFGRGLFEPVDELTTYTESANPELLAYLMQMVKDLDFDMKDYLRVLYNTRAYQRQASRTAAGSEEVYRFPGPVLRRMSAEQMWDSMVTLAVGTDNGVGGGAASGDAELGRPDLEGMSESELLAYARRLSRGGGGMMAMRRERRDGPYAGFVRASELPQPAPPGHFLWRFGQSDRQLIQNASREPTKTQVLTLLNGPIDHVLLKDKSELWKNVLRADSNREKLEVIWLSILTRRPTNAEVSYAKQEIRDSGDTAFDNLVWALLNTREFMFIQ